MTEIETINSVCAQLWRDSDNQEADGRDVSMRLHKFFSRPMRNIHQTMIDTPVGGCIKTGVSAYIRTH